MNVKTLNELVESLREPQETIESRFNVGEAINQLIRSDRKETYGKGILSAIVERLLKVLPKHGVPDERQLRYQAACAKLFDRKNLKLLDGFTWSQVSVDFIRQTAGLFGTGARLGSLGSNFDGMREVGVSDRVVSAGGGNPEPTGELRALAP